MSNGIVFQQTLHNTDGGSDKLYRVTLTEEADGLHSVRAEACRRGDAYKDMGFKAQGATLEAATKMALATLKGKIKGGYKVIETFDRDNSGAEGVTAAAVAVAAAVEVSDSGHRPQLLNIVDEATADALINDTRSIMQEKHDGRRHAVRFDTETPLTGINKLGRTVPVDPRIAEALGKLFAKAGGYLVDGELVGDTLHIFDLLQAGPTAAEGDIRHMGYMDRMGRLQRIAGLCPEAFEDGSIKVVATFVGREAKRAAFADFKAANAEGVVFKVLDSVYEAGRPNSNGPHIKFKFTETASFLVKGVNAKRSIELGLFDEDGSLRSMGNCTLPANHSIPRVGQVCEVRYLYAYPGGSVFQPTYLGLRDDIADDECSLAKQHIKYKAGTGEDE